MVKNLISDPRHFQIMTLSSLLGILLFFSDFAPGFDVVALTLGSALLAQLIFSKAVKAPLDFRSPLITALSLCLLFKTNAIWIYALAGIAAMASKFFIRFENKHIFNPANFAIVAGLVFFPYDVWVSPGQWGNAIWLGFFLIAMAYIVLNKAQRADMALFFLGAWAFLIFGRAVWLGDPVEIPLHAMQSGALLIFAFFMISDPKSTPDHRMGRLLFAITTAILAYILQYEFQVREAIFYALFLTSLTTPIIDMVLQDKRYQWGTS